MPVLVVVVDARDVGPDPGHDGCARGVARGSRAVCVREQDAAGRQPVEVGCVDRAPVTAQAVCPVVQVVDGDKENVRSGSLRLLGPEQAGCRRGQRPRSSHSQEVAAGTHVTSGTQREPHLIIVLSGVLEGSEATR